MRGHYRTECPRTQETPEERDDSVRPYITGMEKEPEKELTQEPESETESLIPVTTTTWDKYKLSDIAWDTTDLDSLGPKRWELFDQLD